MLSFVLTLSGVTLAMDRPVDPIDNATTAADRNFFVCQLLSNPHLNPHARCALINRAIEIGPVPYHMGQEMGEGAISVHTHNQKLIDNLQQGTYFYDKIDVNTSDLNIKAINASIFRNLADKQVGIFTLEIKDYFLVGATYRSAKDYIQSRVDEMQKSK